MSNDNPFSLEWATPVLIQRTPDGVLFDIRQTAIPDREIVAPGVSPPLLAPPMPETASEPTDPPRRSDPRSKWTPLGALAAAGILILALWVLGPFPKPWNTSETLTAQSSQVASCDDIQAVVGDDAGHLVYGAEDELAWQLYVYDFSTCEAIDLARFNPANDLDYTTGNWRPAVSHSGSEVAYLRKTASGGSCGVNELWLMNLNGTENRLVRSDIGGLCYVSWAADDQSLLTIDAGRQDGIGVFTRSGRSLPRFGPSQVSYVSVDSDNAIVYAQEQQDNPDRNDIFLQLPAGDTIPIAVNPDEDEDAPNISADGQGVVYQVNRRAASGAVQRELKYALAPTWNTQDVWSVGADNANPVWMPNRRAIAFVDRYKADKGSCLDEARYSLWIAPMDGTEPIKLDVGSHCQIFYLSWGS
jgi:hypothetical protein